MMHDWISPTAADWRAERDAMRRDREDLVSLNRLRDVVSYALACVEQCPEIMHPAARFAKADLESDLRGALKDIDGTTEMIRTTPLCVEDDA